MSTLPVNQNKRKKRTSSRLLENSHNFNIFAYYPNNNNKNNLNKSQRSIYTIETYLAGINPFKFSCSIDLNKGKTSFPTLFLRDKCAQH